MAKFLFVMPPLTGHVNPNISVAAALAARGHSVAWCGDINTLGKLLPEGARCYPAPNDLPADFREYAESHRPDTRGAAAFKFAWEEVFIPLALAMIPGVNAAFDDFGPDVVISDQQTLAGGAVAQLRGVPWATSASSSAEFTRPLQDLPKVEEWLSDKMVSVQLEAGLPRDEAERVDLRFSDWLVLGFTTASLVGTSDEWPDHYSFVGPAISGRPERGVFPWDRLDSRVPKVLVSVGTLNRSIGERFYAVAIEALGDLQVQGIIAADPDGLGTLPDNVIAQSWIPQLALLEHMDAVVCHGGHNTTCEALAAGLPLVIAPIRDDQTIVAQQVVDAGAGVRVKFGRVGPTKLGAAISQVLEDPRFRENALRIAESFQAAGGAETAAMALEALVGVAEHGRRPE